MKYFIQALLMLILIECQTERVRSQNLNKYGDVYKTEIVRILNSTTSETGSGLIISDTGNELLVVTAKHVITGTQKVSVEVENNAAWLEGTVVNEHDHYDLALIKISFTRAGQSKLRYVTNIEGGDNVFYMSVNDHKRALPADGSGRVIDRDSEYLILRLKNVQQGDSGTPVFSNEGVVGMIFTRSPVQALSIELIKSVVEEWHQKWQIESTKIVRKAPEDPNKPNVNKEVATKILNITVAENECLSNIKLCVDDDLSTFWSCKAPGWKKLLLTLNPKTSFRFIKIYFPHTSYDELLTGEIYLPQLKKRFSFKKTLLRFKEPEADGDWYAYDLGAYFISDIIELTVKIKKDLATDVVTELRIFEIKVTGPLK